MEGPRYMGAGPSWALNRASQEAKHLYEEASRKFQPLTIGVFLTEAPEIVEQRHIIILVYYLNS